MKLHDILHLPEIPKSNPDRISAAGKIIGSLAVGAILGVHFATNTENPWIGAGAGALFTVLVYSWIRKAGRSPQQPPSDKL